MSYCDDYDDGCGVGPLEYKCQTCGGNLTVLFVSMVCDHCNPPTTKPVPSVNEVYISGDSTAPLTLIDAHGPDYGLRVTYNFYDKSVLLEEWAELCEPDENGSYNPHIRRAEIPLRLLMSRGLGLSKGPSMRDRVISTALAWVGYYGGTEEHVDDDARPCEHFGMYYGPERDMPPGGWPEHMTCRTCGIQPTNDPY